MSTGPATPDAGEAFPGFAPRSPRRSAVREAPGPTAALPTLALSVFIILVFSRSWITLLVGPEADPESSGLLRNLFFPGYLAAILLAARDWRSTLRAAVSGALPLALAGLALASCLWSIAPDLSLRRAMALTLTTFAGVALAARLDWLGMARAMAASFILLALGSALVALALPDLGRMGAPFPGAWRGLWSDKNALGDYMALGVCACAAAAILDRRLRAAWIGGVGLCLLLIALSTSKTALISLAAGLSVLAAIALAKRSPASAVAVALGVVALGAVAGVALFLDSHLLFALLGKDATLTGRTVIWEAVLRRIAERPITGFGYAVVWTDPSGWGPVAWIAKEAQFMPRHAHNSWLEAQIELGVFGSGMLALFALQAGWRVLRGGDGAWLAGPMLAAFGIVTLTETVTLNYNDFMWVLIPALAIRLGMRTQGAAPRVVPAPLAPASRPWPD
jgi:O-antigen ligase